MDVKIAEAEIDVFEYSQRGEEVPHGKKLRIRIDCETVTVDARHHHPEPQPWLRLGLAGGEAEVHPGRRNGHHRFTRQPV